tara:strand:- start:83 stop:355 length:273 start_codon:yes stop_codon:yes gene_type:complete
MKDEKDLIFEEIKFVSTFAKDCDDWVTIKKEVMKNISPRLRKNFSTRDPITKNQHLNEFEKQLINYYRDITGITLVLRTLSERKEMFDVI